MHFFFITLYGVNTLSNVLTIEIERYVQLDFCQLFNPEQCIPSTTNLKTETIKTTSNRHS